MIAKSIITGLVLAGVAGSGVFYGLSPDEGSNTVKTATDKQIKPISPVVKVVEAKKDHPHTEKKLKRKTPELTLKKESPSESSETAEPEKKWIDQYLERRRKKEAQDGEKAELEIGSDIKKTGENIDERVEIDVELTDETGVKPFYRGAKAEAIIIGDPDNSEDVAAEVERILEELGVDNLDVQEGKSNIRIIRKKSKTKRGERSTDPAYEKITVILEQAKDIQSLDLRDRAYLNVVDFSLIHNYFGEAKNAMFLINQPELRETARSRIATHYAITGNSDAAFEMVDSVELTDFKDPLRIQIIEALIASDRHMKNPH